MSKIGLIAGSDDLPLILAREAAGENEVIAIAIKGYTSEEIETLVSKTYWVGVGEIGKAIDIFSSQKVTRAVMAGKIPQSIIFADIELDVRAQAVLKNAKDRQTESLLKAVAREFEKGGIQLLDARTYLGGALCKRGVLTGRRPTGGELGEIAFGRKILRQISGFDIGQTIVVKEMAVLAIEAIEGTDAAIRRAARLSKPGIVVVKMAKAHQDMRFDLPVIGITTIKTLREVKASVLAIESKRTVILNKDEVIRLANGINLSIVGF